MFLIAYQEKIEKGAFLNGKCLNLNGIRGFLIKRCLAVAGEACYNLKNGCCEVCLMMPQRKETIEYLIAKYGVTSCGLTGFKIG